MRVPAVELGVVVVDVVKSEADVVDVVVVLDVVVVGSEVVVVDVGEVLEVVEALDVVEQSDAVEVLDVVVVGLDNVDDADVSVVDTLDDAEMLDEVEVLDKVEVVEEAEAPEDVVELDVVEVPAREEVLVEDKDADGTEEEEAVLADDFDSVVEVVEVKMVD